MGKLYESESHLIKDIKQQQKSLRTRNNFCLYISINNYHIKNLNGNKYSNSN